MVPAIFCNTDSIIRIALKKGKRCLQFAVRTVGGSATLTLVLERRRSCRHKLGATQRRDTWRDKTTLRDSLTVRHTVHTRDDDGSIPSPATRIGECMVNEFCMCQRCYVIFSLPEGHVDLSNYHITALCAYCSRITYGPIRRIPLPNDSSKLLVLLADRLASGNITDNEVDDSLEKLKCPTTPPATA